jgi:hypothetical protein
MLLLQASSYDRGYAMGQAMGPCCCLSFVLLIGMGILGGVAYAIWRGTRSPSTGSPLAAASPPGSPPPGSPPPSHHTWAQGAQPDFAKMQAQQADLFGRLAPNQLPESEAINQAAKKLVAQDFDGAIAAYEEVAQRFPHRGGDAHGQIGAAWFFKGDFDRALFHYRKAIELGAPPEDMADNIREAEEAKQKRGY